MSPRERLSIAGSVLLGTVIAVSACAGPPASQPDAPPPGPSATPTPSVTPSAPPARFAQPADCASLLPQSRADRIASLDLILLGGPGGKFGDTYLAEATPEQVAGGITCIWGDRTDNLSVLTISVAPLSPATRPGVVTDLTTQGLNAEIRGNIASYSQLGDEDGEPAILNVIRQDSWISVISTSGGQDDYDTAVAISNEVALQVYETG